MAELAPFQSQQGVPRAPGEACPVLTVEAADRVTVYTEHLVLLKPPRARWGAARRRWLGRGKRRGEEQWALEEEPSGAAPGRRWRRAPPPPARCRRVWRAARVLRVCDRGAGPEEPDGAWGAARPAADGPAEDAELDDRWEAPPSPWGSRPPYSAQQPYGARQSYSPMPRLRPPPSPLYYPDPEDPQVHVQECPALPAARAYLVVPLGRAAQADRATLHALARDAASSVPAALRLAERPEAVVVECRAGGDADATYIDQVPPARARWDEPSGDRRPRAYSARSASGDRRARDDFDYGALYGPPASYSLDARAPHRGRPAY